MTSGAARGARLLARLGREQRLPVLGVGAEVELSGAFRRAESPAARGFDHAAFLRRRGVAGELVVEEIGTTGSRRGGVRGALDAARVRAEKAIGAGLAPAAAGLAKGMALGADETVPPSVRDDFRDAGLSHLLAASGTNVMLLVALAALLLAGAGLSYRGRVPALLCLIALYVPLAGAGPSIQRAGVMGAAAVLAVALARPASRWHALGLAACVTLALNPRAWGEVGWQLSFAAVAGILLLGPSLRRGLSALGPALAEGVATTVSATVATGPLLAHHFGTIAVAAPIANVVALPLVAPIMWLAMLRAVLGQVATTVAPLADLAGVANATLGAALGPLLGGLERLAALFADMPGGQRRMSLGHPAAVAAAYAAIALTAVAIAHNARRLGTSASTAAGYVRRLPRGRRAALATIVVLTAFMALARGLSPPDPPASLTVTFLDVGQGDATLVQHPDGSAVLFDGGPPEGGVARLLRRAGVRRLSALVMTHASRDHHGGLAEVVERFPVEVLIDGGDGTADASFRAVVSAAAARGTRRIAGIAPLALRAGSIRIELLSPGPRPSGPPPEDPNPRAVVAVVSSDGFDVLLSADAESEALLPLSLPDVEAMKVAHHGSADAGLSELLARVRPEIASIPVGPNSYGHPAASTLAALADAGVRTWRNDLDGTIEVVVEDGVAEVEAERDRVVEGTP
jgi:competence protein ComEC